jgi:hypothetical protein
VQLAVLVALLAAPAAAGSGRVWAINCNREQYKPRQIVLACGDGVTLLRKLSWSGWSSSKASGKGQYAFDDCQPDCAAGHFHSYPVKVTMTKPKHCAHQSHQAFSALALAYTGHRPTGAPTRLTLPCPF